VTSRVRDGGQGEHGALAGARSGGSSPSRAPADPVDMLVPPARPPSHAVLVVGLVAALLAGVGLLSPSGLVVPRFDTGTGGVYRTATTGSGVSFAVVVRNNGWLPATITSVDTAADWLDGGAYAFAHVGAGGSVAGRPWRTSATLPAHGTVMVELTYGSYDCARIVARDDLTVTLRARGPLGATFAVPVETMHFDGPSAPGFHTGSGPDQIGWPAALTWSVCHRSSRPR